MCAMGRGGGLRLAKHWKDFEELLSGDPQPIKYVSYLLISSDQKQDSEKALNG